MLVKINETNLVAELKDARVNGVWQDILEINPIGYSDVDGDKVPVITQSEFAWWTQIIENYESDEMEIENFANLNNIDVSVIRSSIAKQYDGDMEALHGIVQNVLCELRG